MNQEIPQEPITIDYREDGRILVIQINGMTREAVDAFIETIQTEIVDVDSSLLLTVIDYTNTGGMVSPYFIGKMKNITGDQIRRDMRGRAGVVTSVDLFRLVFNPVVKMFSRDNKNLTIQFFKTVDEAVEWVSEYEE